MERSNRLLNLFCFGFFSTYFAQNPIVIFTGKIALVLVVNSKNTNTYPNKSFLR